jgi:hypothetical protein
MSIDTARSDLQSSLLCIGSFVVMAVLGGFKEPDFSHFCRRFKNPFNFQKPVLRQKSRVIFKKPASDFYIKYSYGYV